MGVYGGRDSLEKGKYLANSYTAARVNVYYKLSSFFLMLFRSGTEILMAVCSFSIFFPGVIFWEETSYFNEWKVHFQWEVHFQLERSPHWGCICFYGRREAKKLMERGTPQSCLSPLEQSLVCVVTGFKKA